MVPDFDNLAPNPHVGEGALIQKLLAEMGIELRGYEGEWEWYDNAPPSKIVTAVKRIGKLDEHGRLHCLGPSDKIGCGRFIHKSGPHAGECVRCDVMGNAPAKHTIRKLRDRARQAEQRGQPVDIQGMIERELGREEEPIVDIRIEDGGILKLWSNGHVAILPPEAITAGHFGRGNYVDTFLRVGMRAKDVTQRGPEGLLFPIYRVDPVSGKRGERLCLAPPEAIADGLLAYVGTRRWAGDSQQYEEARVREIAALQGVRLF